MTKKAFALSLVLLLFPLWASATTYSYPNTRYPLFSVDIPDHWSAEVEGELLHSGPPDGSVYLGFWALDSNLSGDDVGDAVDEIVSGMVYNPSIDSEEELTINGIPFYYFEGSGQYVEGGLVNYGVAMFSPDGNTVCVVIYFGAPADEARHEQTLIRIIESIRRG